MTTSSATSSVTTAGRSLHLVDLENLVGDPRAERVQTISTFERYLEASRWVEGDHVIVATNPLMMGKIAFDLTIPASIHAAHGRDGADTMLLALAPAELVTKRYGRLVIGSGDGIFGTRANQLYERGVTVEVVARPDGCSRRLRRFDCSFLDRATDVVLAA